jgi:hypothetical protein
MIAGEAQKRNSALEAFSAFIGEWATTGTHPYVPGKTFHGRTLFEWIEGGAFIRISSEIDEPEIPSGISILGSDDKTGEFYILYFDERGVSRKIDVSIEKDVMRWSRMTPEFSQKMVLTLSSNQKTIVSKGEMSKDGGAWEPDLELTYMRVK